MALNKPMPKTSTSHPLLINGVHIPGCQGRIGMTFCPGKKQPNALSGHWDRDLATDLRAISAWGAKVLVSFIEEHEFTELRVNDLPRYAAKNRLEWIHLAIPDMSIPSRAIEKQWQRIAKDLKKRLMKGEDVVFHCKGGLGRTGTMAACLLREFGVSGPEAVQAVRKARPGTIENSSQKSYVLNYRPNADRGAFGWGGR